MAAQQHSFVSVTVIPIDARVNIHTKAIEYSPKDNADASAEQMCAICHQPMDEFSINSVCPGSDEVPDDVSSLL